MSGLTFTFTPGTILVVSAIASAVLLMTVTAQAQPACLQVARGPTMNATTTPRPTFATLAVMAEKRPLDLIARIEVFGLSPGLRARAAEAMGKVADSNLAVPVLLKLLNDSEIIVQEGAIYGLRRHMNEEVRDRLRQVIEAPATHQIVREVASEMLED